MTSSNFSVRLSNNPKLQLFDQLLRQCYVDRVNFSKIFVVDEEYGQGDISGCPRTFDGFSCWSEAPPSSTLYQPCPDFVVGFDSNRFAYKRCTENGSWYLHPLAKKPWTNYTSCVDIEDLDFRNSINNIYVGGYSLSVAALLLSIIIFLYFRALHCTRIRIHIHLFSATVLSNILWIIWYKTVVDHAYVVRDNRSWCQVLHILTNYFMVTSYIWMFCESLYLHIALVVVFIKDEVAMRWFVALGWGLSLLIITVYAGVRSSLGETDRCWMEQGDSFWIIFVPVVLSLIASLVFLVNVVRILLTKLNPAPNNQASAAAKKAVRAALILVPLFGLHFIVIPFRPAHGSPGEGIYQIVSALITSLQGFCVAVLFCLTNHEVLTALKVQITKILHRNEGRVVAGFGGDSLAQTRENIV